MGDLLALRQVRESDRWILWEWRNSDRIRSVSTNDEVISRASHDLWFTRQFPSMRDKTIIVEWSDSPVGWYQIEKWDSRARTGEWGIALGETQVPLGLGGMLPILALSHAFERLEAQQMTGRVLEINTNVLSIMRRLKIPLIAVNEKSLIRLDGSSSRMFVFRLERDEWSVVLDAGRALVPSTLRASIDRVLSSPILD